MKNGNECVHKTLLAGFTMGFSDWYSQSCERKSYILKKSESWSIFNAKLIWLEYCRNDIKHKTMFALWLVICTFAQTLRLTGTAKFNRRITQVKNICFAQKTLEFWTKIGYFVDVSDIVGFKLIGDASDAGTGDR